VATSRNISGMSPMFKNSRDNDLLLLKITLESGFAIKVNDSSRGSLFLIRRQMRLCYNCTSLNCREMQLRHRVLDDYSAGISSNSRANQMLCYRNGRMWLSRTSLLLVLVGLVNSQNNEDDTSSIFIEEAKNLFSQKSFEDMAQTFTHSDSGKQVWRKFMYSSEDYLIQFRLIWSLTIFLMFSSLYLNIKNLFLKYSK